MSFLLIFAFHKWGFVSLYQTPPRYDQTLANLSTTILLWSVVVHVLFALWQFTNPDMFAQVSECVLCTAVSYRDPGMEA